MNYDWIWIYMYLAIFILMTAFCWRCSASELIDMDIIAQMESSHNSKADNGIARGLYGISDICLKDFNIQTKSHITKDQLFDPVYNTLIADFYINKRIPELLIDKDIPVDTNHILIAYHWGISHVGQKLPDEVRQYLVKYHLLKAEKIAKGLK